MRYPLLLIVPLVCSIAFLPACQTREHITLVSAEDGETQSPAQAVSETTRSAATALLAALTDEQKKLAQYDIKAPLRKDWHFIPRERQGLMLGDMTDEQKTLVHKLMQTALSDNGYLKATDIIWLETILYEMSNQAPFRSPSNYALQVFGDPADEKAAWGWRLEGHHLSINLTYTPEGIGLTPLFFGTNPAVVPSGPLAGKRVLADAHNLAVELAKSMNDEQRKEMMLDKKPSDVITGPGRESSLQEPVGVLSSDLSFHQRELLVQVLVAHQFSFNLPHRMELAQRLNARDVFDLGTPAMTFAWAGPIDADKPFYYRIHGSGLVIEYSCQGKNHVHTVMHDLTDPLQEDLLKKHFEEHEHHE